MNCPYCSFEMIPGYLYGDRYRAKWLPDTKKLLFGIFAIGGEPVGELNLLRQRIHCYKCSSCKKIVIDLKDA